MNEHRYDIRVERMPSGSWLAIEDQRYDVDGDSEGYHGNYAQGAGRTKWEAIRDLIDSLEEHDDE